MDITASHRQFDSQAPIFAARTKPHFELTTCNHIVPQDYWKSRLIGMNSQISVIEFMRLLEPDALTAKQQTTA